MRANRWAKQGILNEVFVALQYNSYYDFIYYRVEDYERHCWSYY